jgi:hypothetical protein
MSAPRTLNVRDGNPFGKFIVNGLNVARPP